MKDRLVAATKKETAQRTAEAVKGVESAINAIRKQMSDLKADPTADLNGFQTNAGHATIPFGTTELAAFLSPDALNRSLSDSARTIRTSLAPSALMAMFGFANPGPDAPNLMKAFLGMNTARVGLAAFGQYVGMYDVLDGNVYRTVPNGSGGLKKGVKSMADVQAAMAAPPAVTATASTWDAYFGGSTGPGAEYKDILHQALNFFVDDAKLAAPGGLGSDILIAAEVGFGIASFVDPIGIADAGSGVIKLAQGDVSGALIDFGGIAVPFGAEKLLRAAKKAPTAALASAVENVGNMAKNAKNTINKAGDAITDAGAGRAKILNGKACTNGPTCFIAGTKVLMQQENDPQVAVSEDGSLTLVTGTSVTDETVIAGGVGAISLAAGIVAAIAKSKLEESERRGHTRSARSRKRSDDQLTEPSLPPPDPRSPTELSSGLPLSVADAVVPAVKPKRRWASQVLTAAMLLCFTACGWCWSQVALNPSGSAYSSPVAPPTGASSFAAAGAPRRTRNVTENIEDVRLGRRVVGRNPLREQTESPTDITPATHRAVRLEMDQHGALYELAFVRPLSWLDEQHAAVGETIPLVMTEMGLDGEARVIAIDSCPEIEPDDGTGRMIVTGTMKHLATNVLEIEIAAETEPLGVTDTHPIWSEDRHQFVVAGQLRTGERLRQSNGHLTQITRITPKRGPPVMVYNLEIDAEHVYHVGENGLLVHNSCFTQDQQALQGLVNEMTKGGRKPLSTSDANTVLDWAKETKYPGARAKAGDVSYPSNWSGRRGHPNESHIHIPGVGSGHIPVDPGVGPRPFPL